MMSGAGQAPSRRAPTEGDLRYRRRRRREAIGALARLVAFAIFAVGTAYAVHVGTAARYLPFSRGDWRNAWAVRIAWVLYGLLVAVIVISAVVSRSRWGRQRKRQNAVPPGWVAHIVGNGETLGSIAKDELGDRSAWIDLWRHNANRRQPGGGRLIWPDQTLLAGWTIYHPRRRAFDVSGLPPDQARELRADLARQAYFATLDPVARDGPRSSPFALTTVGARYLPEPWALAVATMVASQVRAGTLDPASVDPEWIGLARSIEEGRWRPHQVITVDSALVEARSLPPGAHVRALPRPKDDEVDDVTDLVAAARELAARREAAVANLLAGRPAEAYEGLLEPARDVAVALVVMAYYAGDVDILSIADTAWRRAIHALYWQVRCADAETLPLAEGVVRNPHDISDHQHGSPVVLADALVLGVEVQLDALYRPLVDAATLLAAAPRPSAPLAQAGRAHFDALAARAVSDASVDVFSRLAGSMASSLATSIAALDRAAQLSVSFVILDAESAEVHFAAPVDLPPPWQKIDGEAAFTLKAGQRVGRDSVDTVCLVPVGWHHAALVLCGLRPGEAIDLSAAPRWESIAQTLSRIATPLTAAMVDHDALVSPRSGSPRWRRRDNWVSELRAGNHAVTDFPTAHRARPTATRPLIRILGQIAIDNGDAALPVRPSRSGALAAYLGYQVALGAGTVTSAAWHQALGTETRDQSGSASKALAMLKRCLGRAPDGTPRLTVARDSSLCLVDVDIDIERVVGGDVEAWGLVTGEALTGVAAPWVMNGGAATIAHMLTTAAYDAVATADRAAARMVAAQLRVALGDAPEAIELALQVAATDGPSALESEWAKSLSGLDEEQRELFVSQLGEIYRVLRSQVAEVVPSWAPTP